MTRTPRSLPLAAAFLALLGLAAFAPSADAACGRRVDRIEKRQQQRIGRGIARGAITPREAVRLERMQARIQRAEARAKSDGTLTAGECRHLAVLQKKAGKQLRRAVAGGPGAN